MKFIGRKKNIIPKVLEDVLCIVHRDDVVRPGRYDNDWCARLYNMAVRYGVSKHKLTISFCVKSKKMKA